MSRRGTGGCLFLTASTRLRPLLAGRYGVGAPEASGECVFHGLLRKCEVRLCFEHFLRSLSMEFSTSLCLGMLGSPDVLHFGQTTATTCDATAPSTLQPHLQLPQAVRISYILNLSGLLHVSFRTCETLSAVDPSQAVPRVKIEKYEGFNIQ